MKTLIFNGSPRKDGDTVFLIDSLKRELGGEFYQVDACFCGISPCVDCRFCWTHEGCARKDGMEDVFAWMNEADTIVIASPVYFSELTGSLLNVLSRLQYVYTSARFRGKAVLSDRKRNGIVLLAGGGNGKPEKAVETASCLLRHMKAEVLGVVCSRSTDRIPAREDVQALAELQALVREVRGRVHE